MLDDPERRRALILLEGILRMHGVSKRDLDERLGRAPGYSAQVFSGRLELKYLFILAVLRVLSIKPREFFLALFPEQESEEARSLAMLQRFLPPRKVPSGPTDDELNRRIRELIREEESRRDQPNVQSKTTP